MPALLSRLPPAITALLLQFIAVGLIVASTRLTGIALPPLILALLCGALASLLSRLAGQARWWLAIQLLFTPLLVLMLALNLPSGLYLAAFLILLVVYWSTFRSQVPLYLSSNKIWRALESLLPPQGTRFTFIDLGSGLGGVLTHLAQAKPDGLYRGVEAAPFPFLWSWLRIKFGGHRNCEVHWGSMWDCDLSQYDVVFAYLSPVPMERLWLKAKAEMRPGSLFISSTFSVPEQMPQQTLQVDDLHHSTLLIWRM